MVQIEVCSNGIESTWAAFQGGATRVELCDNLGEGGTTPSYGLVKKAVQQIPIEIWPIVRPRGGDFLYSSYEKEIMLEDIFQFHRLNCHGIVLGMLQEDGTIDESFLKDCIRQASGKPIAFHRAIDMTPNLLEATEMLIENQVVRILTSGGCNKAADGIETIQQMQQKYGNRISIMPGSGVDESNVVKILKETQCNQVHVSLRMPVKSAMEYQKQNIYMGKPDFGGEYSFLISNAERLKTLVNLTQNIFE
jgi:copper homeostasis protein